MGEEERESIDFIDLGLFYLLYLLGLISQNHIWSLENPPRVP